MRARAGELSLALDMVEIERQFAFGLRPGYDYISDIGR
jgi:hypothetical protein